LGLPGLGDRPIVRLRGGCNAAAGRPGHRRNGKRQSFERPRGQFEDLFVIAQVNDDAGCVGDRIRPGFQT
jgi:hypothetical protein